MKRDPFSISLSLSLSLSPPHHCLHQSIFFAATMDIESNYDIAATAHFIHTHNFTRVALQFPDNLLKDATRVVAALRKKLQPLRESDATGTVDQTDVGLFVMADTTYGSCCVDEVGASHIKADCVIHYGHTCFSPTTTVPAFYVFGKASICVADCAESLSKYAMTNSKPIMVLFGLEYAHSIQQIRKSLLESSISKAHFADVPSSSMFPSKDITKLNGVQEPASGCSDNASSDGASGTKYSIGGLTWKLPDGQSMEDYLLFWIGLDNSAFSNVVLTFNACEIAGYLHMINQMTELIVGAGKKAYTLVMGRPNPAKLANFPECDVFLYVSCAQTALLDSKEYLAPVITPFEATIAFSRGSQWTGAYVMNFGDLINLPQVEVRNHEEEARFSFFHGGYVEDFDDQENVEEEREALALVNATEKALQLRDNCNTLIKGGARSGAEFLAKRSYQGLNMPNENTSPEPYFVGRKGRASQYEDEKNKH